MATEPPAADIEVGVSDTINISTEKPTQLEKSAEDTIQKPSEAPINETKKQSEVNTEKLTMHTKTTSKKPVVESSEKFSEALEQKQEHQQVEKKVETQDQNVTMEEPLKDDMVLADLAKAVCDRSKGSSHSLGVQQHPLKKGSFAPSSTVGRKKDLEKIKLTRDLLVESRSVKTIDAHETKVSIDVMLKYASRIWYFGQCQSIGSHVNSGGLALFWDPLDVKPSNGIFTWNNRWSGEEVIFEWLDRFLVSYFWVGGGLVTISKILDWKGSNHWPIKFFASSFAAPKNLPFKFQLMWLWDSSLHELVAKWWREGGPSFGIAMYFFIKKLQYVKYHFKRWNMSCFGHIKSRKRSALERLALITHQIWDNGFSNALGKEESQTMCNVEEWEICEEIFWKQKAWFDWLQEGDRNYAFFHHSVQAHHNKGYISSLITSEGLQISSLSAMSCEARQYYSDLFTKDSPPVMDEDNLILSCIPSLVTNAMNVSLFHLVSLLDLEDVVFGMNKGIDPGPNGFPVEFFQEFWDIINLDLMEVVRESLCCK
ncbi:uncharacterized protein LOC131031127 [Cryptomeria japonica]|uniref:uncharacterized protein LOC131031127 n=1 Tax=Cryptomeria japonica TaxID=3369 RepID=UPI0027DA0190|nr:uncharacterized protein LOC131031127 [Cryptomeria japonica]